ncbi:hypothetical protein BB559_002849 [Furculomyces boomerangus]|uniref:Iron hydrogenase large subunit C-terminal domain-containing protein n=1 Tax=Furculomyces boomerangus TaxID=61424 RepID=A0A2T9YRQ7_9FUNG|nr:hypothetical protein BB559_002849 [Furculomyces boomerangus]
MQFSNGVRITELNDYLAPELDCIKPVTIQKTNNDVQSTIKVGEKNEYYEVTKEGEQVILGEAKISLADCLACSGCVTTAEAVLITLQSHKQVIQHLESKKNGNGFKKIVFSISPQSRASLGIKYYLSPQEISSFISKALSSVGVDMVLDTNFARGIMQVEAAKEFIDYLKEKQRKKDEGGKKRLVLNPLISSWCPGVVCYAEKSQHAMVNCFSKIRSPQQIMGSIIKDFLYETEHLYSNEICHVSVMPCFDKKLEASRPEFISENVSPNQISTDQVSRLVDIVISTAEFDQMLTDMNISFSNANPLNVLHSFLDEIESHPPNNSLDSCSNNQNETNNCSLQTSPNKPTLDFQPSFTSSAGGTLEFVLSVAAKELYSVDIPISDIINGTDTLDPESLGYTVQVKYPSRNKSKDYKEISVSIYPTNENHSNEPPKILTGCAIYGFRHLQTLVRKIKTGTVGNYDYIEVAACPGACGNGGGQIRDIPAATLNNTDNAEKSTEKVVKQTLTSRVEALYRNSEASRQPKPEITNNENLTIDWYLSRGEAGSSYFDLGVRGTPRYNALITTGFNTVNVPKSSLKTSW